MKLLKYRKQIIIGFLISILVYLGGYAYFRMTGNLIHLQNKSSPSKGHIVKATEDEWSDILSGVAANSESKLAKSHASTDKILPKILNLLFFPLRKCEAGIWNLFIG